MKNLKDKAVAEFDSLSRYYDLFAVSWFFKPFYKRVLEQIRTVPGEKVLSVGCGTGTLELLLAKSFPKSTVVGLDLSKGMLEKAGIKASGVSNISFIEGDAEQLPFESASFDVVICSHSFHHYPNQEKTLSEMRRVLHSQGILFIVDGLKDGVLARFWMLVTEHIFEPGVKHHSFDELRKKLGDAGFTAVSVERLMVAYGIIKAS